MAEQVSQDEMNKGLFMGLIMMLGSSTMQHMGKQIHPATGKIEMNLEAAQETIDLLAMLEAKTKNNLDRDEARLLRTTLSSLQMTYVETAEKANATPQPAAAPSTDSPPAADEEKTDPSEVSTSKVKSESDPKFHKSYGA